MDINFNPNFIAFVPLITGIMQVIKVTRFPSQFLPLASVALGVVLCGAWYGFSIEAAFTGIIAGLSASGFYSTVKAGFKK
jgi:hypothetical protein